MRIFSQIRRAEELHRKSQFSKALLLYEDIDKALRVNSSELDDEQIYYLRLNEGHCARLAGDFLKSVNYYKLALKVAKRIDRRAIADAYAGLGTALRAMGQFKEAIESFDHALKVYRKIGDLEGQAYIFWAKGGTLRFMGYLKKALVFLKRALSVYEELKNKSGIGYSLCGLGGISRIMGDFELSLHYYTEANQTLRKINDKFGVAYSYCGIANANRMLENFDKARKYFELATKNYEEIGDKVSYAYTLWGEGTLLKMLGDFEGALEKFSKVEKIFRETRDRRGFVYTELGKIEIYFLSKGKIQDRKIERILEISREYGYNFERLHIILVSKLMRGVDVNFLHKEYKNLGSKFLKRIKLELPLNLP